MAHTSMENLQDLATILERIRNLEGIKEPKPGIFYIKSKPFLHFHDDGVKRWADAKEADAWGKPIMIAFNAKKAEKDRFYDEVLRRYGTMAAKKSRK